MSEKRINCWEFMKCGREPGGSKSSEMETCPAAIDKTFNGTNFGKNAGRICWAVAGTFCGGKVQGSFAEKRKSCINCNFFKMVQSDEDTSNNSTNFLRYISESSKHTLLDRLTFKTVKGGERFIQQGETAGAAFIVQRGSCLTVVEKDGELHPVGHRGKGDIVGLTAFLTGEQQQAHVEAETNLDLWVLGREIFDDITKDDPDMVDFLTELVAERFDTGRPVIERTIGKYVTSNIIGTGGFSIVYQGIHTGLNRPVVIKMMRHNMALDPDFLSSFHNEAKIIASLNHKNIIQVYDIEERFRTVFIIMEYIEGETLKDLIGRLKKIPPALTAEFLCQMCEGLEYAHNRGIIHRDINPANVIIKRNDRLKILDFGLACPPDTEDFLAGGQLAYQAPEMIDGEPANRSTDIFAMGITAFEMVTGRKPFLDDNLRKMVNMISKNDIPDPAEIVPDLPEPLRRFILKACRHDPTERYATAARAIADLEPLIRNTGPKLLPPVKRKISSLLLIYSEDHQQALDRLIDEFSDKVRALGIDLKAADFPDI